jgi:DNA primase
MDAHERTCVFFEEQLKTPAAAGAREYLSRRGISEAVIKQFRIGYAPDSGFLLRDRLKGEFDEPTLKASGLFSWKDENGGVGAMYSKFRNRLMFAISNEQGKVIAFGGRVLESAGGDKDKLGPKYLNSPETPIYSKGRVLYNLDKAKEAIRKLDYSIVVEGYFDCISVYNSGLHNVIASSGTAFGEAQVKLLGRYSKNIVVNFDPDAAGAAATERSLAMLVEEEFQIKVIALDAGLDPDLYIRKRGTDAYIDEVRKGRKHFDYLIDRAQAQFSGKSPEAKVKALNYLLPHVQRVPNRIVRDELAKEISQRIGIDSAVLRQELKAAASTRSQQQIKAQPQQQVTPAEKVLVRALLNPEAFGDRVTLRDSVRRALAADALHGGWVTEPIFTAALAVAPETLAEPLSLPLGEAARNHLAAILMEDDQEVTPEMVEVALAALRRPHLERKLQQVQGQIDDASRKGETARIAQLSMEKMTLKRALDQSMRAAGQ